MSSNLIALLTDFGEKDYFAGAMKGVILSINPKAKIIDISHQNPKHDVKSAAFTLLGASRNFPPETNFVVVVDPGVGTDRKCILLRTKNNLNFIGPDNGVFTLVANHYGVEEIREISNEELELPQVSSTFHGRDVMAPVAAHLSCDLEVSEVGPEIESIESFQVSEPEIKDEVLVGEVIHVDDFGNLITNIGEEIVRKYASSGELLRVDIGGESIEVRLVDAFGEVGENESLCYIGGADLLEIAKNQGDLAGDLNVGSGVKVVLKRCVK